MEELPLTRKVLIEKAKPLLRIVISESVDVDRWYYHLSRISFYVRCFPLKKSLALDGLSFYSIDEEGSWQDMLLRQEDCVSYDCFHKSICHE
jgi:hypothetical protein